MIFIRDEPRRSVYFELQINGGTIFCAIKDKMQEKEIKEQKALEESQVQTALFWTKEGTDVKEAKDIFKILQSEFHRPLKSNSYFIHIKAKKLIRTLQLEISHSPNIVL